jgi:hypothetical protein
MPYLSMITLRYYSNGKCRGPFEWVLHSNDFGLPSAKGTCNKICLGKKNNGMMPSDERHFAVEIWFLFPVGL